MPKIEAATVAEHHANMEKRLIDAAESLLRVNPRTRLTAGAVSARAGIARTSIYRYVESVDDLAGIVIARNLPEWLAQVDQSISDAGEDPVDRLVAWTSANIGQSMRTGHAWIVEAARAQPSMHSDTASRNAHSALGNRLSALWADLVNDSEQRQAATALTNGIVEAAFRLLESGLPSRVVAQTACQATRGLAQQLAATGPGEDVMEKPAQPVFDSERRG